MEGPRELEAGRVSEWVRQEGREGGAKEGLERPVRDGCRDGWVEGGRGKWKELS